MCITPIQKLHSNINFVAVLLEKSDSYSIADKLLQFHAAHCNFPKGILMIPYHLHKISTTAAKLKHAMLPYQQNFKNVNSKVGYSGCKSNTTSSFENVTLRPELFPACGKMLSCDITCLYTYNQPIIIFNHLILSTPP